MIKLAGLGRAWLGLAAIGVISALAGCASPTVAIAPIAPVLAPAMMYAQVEDDGFVVKAIDLSRMDPRYLRQEVATPMHISATPGTIVVDPANKFLYLVQYGGRSMRYGIGVGREGFAWSGEAVIKDKQHWPKWFPPKEMQARDPNAAKYPDGMDGGPGNPLGARALYLWQDGKDTLYRLHGTIDPASIGRAVSSGCVRMMNQDIIDLYERVPLDTKVIVIGAEVETPVVDAFGTQVPQG